MQTPHEEPPVRGHDHNRPFSLRLLAGVIFLECAVLAGFTVYFVLQLITALSGSAVGGVAVIVLTAAAAVWLGFIAVGTLRGRFWIRGAAVTVQVLLIALAVGRVQEGGPQGITWLLITPAAAVLVLLFMPSVVRATTRRER